MRERLTGAVILVAVASILVPEIISGPGGDAPSRATEALAEAGPPLTTYELSIDPSRREPGVARDPAAIAQAVPPPVTDNSLLPPDGAGEGAAGDRTSAAADATVARVTADTTPPAAPAPAPAPKPAAEPARAAQTTPAPKPAPAAPRPAAPANESKPAAATATRPAAAAPATTQAAAGKWWVQLGSFSSEQNAQALARKLRDAGYSIDVSRIRSNGKDLHRVRAGPVNDRAAATALQKKLGAAGQQGTLVAP